MTQPLPLSPPGPLYRQVQIEIAHRIAAGRYGPGTRLPSEGELTAEFGVSTITLRRALKELAMEGLVERRPGVGTLVAAGAPPAPIRGHLESLLENLLIQSWGRRYRVLDRCVEPPPPLLVERLRAAEGEALQRNTTVSLNDGAPSSYVTAWIPQGLGERYTAEDLEQAPCIVLLMRDGVVIGRVDQWIGALPASAEAAAALGLAAGTPLVSTSLAVFDSSGRGVEYVEALHRWDRYQYRASLFRSSGEIPAK